MKKLLLILFSLMFSISASAETLRILAEAGDEATLTRAAAQFEEANPGVTVEASYLGWDDFMATIKLKLADNNPPGQRPHQGSLQAQPLEPHFIQSIQQLPWLRQPESIK